MIFNVRRSLFFLSSLAVLSCGDAYDDDPAPSGSSSSTESASSGPTSEANPPSPTPAAGADATLSGSVQPILTANCSCHTAALPAANMSLEASKTFAAVVGVQSASGSCSKLKRIEAGKPDDSALIKRIEGSSCGTQMPRGGPPLSADKVSTIRKWVEAGALNN